MTQINPQRFDRRIAKKSLKSIAEKSQEFHALLLSNIPLVFLQGFFYIFDAFHTNEPLKFMAFFLADFCRHLQAKKSLLLVPVVLVISMIKQYLGKKRL